MYVRATADPSPCQCSASFLVPGTVPDLYGHSWRAAPTRLDITTEYKLFSSTHGISTIDDYLDLRASQNLPTYISINVNIYVHTNAELMNQIIKIKAQNI